MYSSAYGPAFRLYDPVAEMMWMQQPAASVLGMGGNGCSCASCSRSRAIDRSRRHSPCWRASAQASPFAAPHVTYHPAAAQVQLHPLYDHVDEDDTYEPADDASDDDYYSPHALLGRACQHQHPLQHCMMAPHPLQQRHSSPAAAHPAYRSSRGGGCMPAAAAAKAQRQPRASAASNGWAAEPVMAACQPPTHVDQHQRQQRQQQAHGPWCGRPGGIPVQVMVGGDDQHPRHQAAPVPVSVHRRQGQQPAAPAEPQPSSPPQPAERRQLTRAEAATTIQASWRMQRLARQRPALAALAAAAAGLRSAQAKFDSFKLPEQAAASSSSQQWQLSHQAYLELNELAMRVLLQLDATSCGVPELRAVKRRLSGDTISLLDSIQAAYSCAVRASMELPDDVVQEAVAAVARTAAAAAHEDHISSSKAGPEAGPGQQLQQPQQQQVQSLAQPEPLADTQQAAVRVVLVCAGSSCDAATQTD